MKFTTLAIAITGAASVTAIPSFWGSVKPIPELTTADWASIQTNEFALPKPCPHAASVKDSKKSLWSAITAYTPFFGPSKDAIEDLLSSIEESLDAFEDDSQKTIWQLINEDEGRYSKIVKLINLEETGKAREVLDDRKASITFFAPENSGIPDPHHKDDSEDDLLAKIRAEPSLTNLLGYHTNFLSNDDHRGPSNETKHHIFQFILRYVLMYHGLGEALSAQDLAGNSTVATVLHPKFGANDGQALRIHIQKTLLPPTLELNFYAKVSTADVKAKNGYVHTIDHPLFPPLSILDAAFIFPKKFSTLTSAVQKVGGEKYLEWSFDREASHKEKKPVFKGTSLTTLFAPTNEAFGKLPDKLIFFLFSPIGGRALAKLLAFHAIPATSVFTELIHTASKKSDDSLTSMGDDPSFKWEKVFESGLGKNGTLTVVAEKKKLLPIGGATKTTLSVNGVEASVIDVPAMNGVFHVIDEVLVPPHHHHGGEDEEFGAVGGWENWESWLPAWVEEA